MIPFHNLSWNIMPKGQSINVLRWNSMGEEWLVFGQEVAFLHHSATVVAAKEE
jgi:hypothetical protein